MSTKPQGYNLVVSVNNIAFSYDDIGEGGIPIIFLHGYPFDRTMWQSQLEFLKSSNRVIAFDLRGFGKSKDEESSLSIDLFTDDLISFMDELSIDKAIVCGLSMGGYIALNAVSKFPERFDALILCDTQCAADTAEAKEKRYKSIDEITTKGATDFNEAFIKNVFYEDSLTKKKDVVEALRKVVFSNSESVIIKGLQALAERSENCSILNEINIPVLIICGREDKVTPLIQSEFMNANIPDSVLRIIDQAGHVSNLEQPDQFNKFIAGFLTSIKEYKVERLSGSQDFE